MLSSYADTPKSDWSILVAFTLVVAAFRANLLCDIAAVPLTSALLTDPTLSWMSKSTCLSVTVLPTIVLFLVGVNVISLLAVAIPFAQTSIGPLTSVP